jgi:phage terminase large subunit-like protein
MIMWRGNCWHYKISVIAYDRWRIEDLQAALQEADIEGLPLEPFGQGHSKVMAPAIEAFQECAVEGRLRHGGNAVLTAAVVNAILIKDTSGNPKIDKSNSNRSGPVRIDGAVALVMALGTAFRAPPEREFASFFV